MKARNSGRGATSVHRLRRRESSARGRRPAPGPRQARATGLGPCQPGPAPRGDLGGRAPQSLPVLLRRAPRRSSRRARPARGQRCGGQSRPRSIDGATSRRGRGRWSGSSGRWGSGRRSRADEGGARSVGRSGGHAPRPGARREAAAKRRSPATSGRRRTSGGRSYDAFRRDSLFFVSVDDAAPAEVMAPDVPAVEPDVPAVERSLDDSPALVFVSPCCCCSR